MPNWCTGTLKVRGTQQNVERFLAESMPQFHCPLDMNECETTLIRQPNSDIYNGYIVGSKRSFVESDIAFLFPSNNNTIILMFERVDCAWSFDVNEFAELSKKFQVDFFFYGFEQGQAFNQKVEIHNGVVIKNEIIKFDDYQWECIYPYLGG